MWYITSWVIFAAALAWPLWFTSRQVWRWRRRRSHCESCGYSLHARVSDICPECGHDVASPSRLIDPRRVALHTTIILELLVASHLFYRLEAIQKRGWIAALPTTYLIMRFSAESDAGRAWSTSRLWYEMGYRLAIADSVADPALRVDTDVITRWQERWLVRKALHIDDGPQFRWADWQIPAARILNDAWRRELLTPSQRDRVSRMCDVGIRTREQWPPGSTLSVSIDLRVAVYGDGFVLTGHALTPGYEDFVYSNRSIDSLLWQPRSLLGVARESGPVEYELVLERFRYDYESGRLEELSRERRVLTTVSESGEYGLAGRELQPEVLETLNPHLGVHSGATTSMAVWFDMGADESFSKSLGDARFAIAVTLLCDGQKVGSGSGTWVSGCEYSFVSGDGRWGVPLLLERAQQWSTTDRPEDHDWTVVIEGDPNLALRDFDATSYWAGRHEFRNIPIAPAR